MVQVAWAGFQVILHGRHILAHAAPTQPPQATNLTASVAAARPPNPDWSSTRACRPCGQSQSSTKLRTTSTRPSRKPAGRASEVPAEKAEKGVTPCHTPGMSCVDLGWGCHSARDVKDCCAPCTREAVGCENLLLSGGQQRCECKKIQLPRQRPRPCHPPHRPRPYRHSAFGPARSAWRHHRLAHWACQMSRPSPGPDCRSRRRAPVGGGMWRTPACVHGCSDSSIRLLGVHIVDIKSPDCDFLTWAPLISLYKTPVVSRPQPSEER